jgi:hypothetical protein
MFNVNPSASHHTVAMRYLRAPAVFIHLTIALSSEIEDNNNQKLQKRAAPQHVRVLATRCLILNLSVDGNSPHVWSVPEHDMREGSASSSK